MSNISIKNKTVLVTGAAGFIGSQLCKRLLTEENIKIIIGIDNLNDSYDVSLKEYRINNLQKNPLFTFLKGDITDQNFIAEVFSQYHPQIVIHLAAQAGVRYSIMNPAACIESNIIGFFNVLEGCRSFPIEHLVYASSSSVYGDEANRPYSTNDCTDRPVSLYAATKKSDELMAYAYSKQYSIPATGLRFFTVYGPEGRPDMAYFSFTNQLCTGQKIQLYNFGKCKRDFTYIDDIIEGLVRVIKKVPKEGSQNDQTEPPYALYNIGNQQPMDMIEVVNILQQELVKAEILPSDFNIQRYIELVPMQPGDVVSTCADTTEFVHDFGFQPATPLRLGLHRFVAWYKQYYKI